VKNKVAAPFREAEFDILYGEGISREGDVLDLAVAQNIVDKSGAWFSFQGERIGQGRENVRQYFKDNRATFLKVDGEVRKKLNITGKAPVPAPPVPPVPGNGIATAAAVVAAAANANAAATETVKAAARK
jgi:recombination protein RecA